MTWFAFEGDGHVYDLNGLAEKDLVATGAHGYATEADALAHRNAPATPEQAALLASYVADAMLPVGGGALGVLQVVNTTAPPPGPGQKNAPANEVQNGGKVGPLSFLSGLGLHWPSAHNFLYRLIKITLGGVMLTGALMKMTGFSSGPQIVLQAARRLPGMSMQ